MKKPPSPHYSFAEFLLLFVFLALPLAIISDAKNSRIVANYSFLARDCYSQWVYGRPYSPFAGQGVGFGTHLEFQEIYQGDGLCVDLEGYIAD